MLERVGLEPVHLVTLAGVHLAASHLSPCSLDQLQVEHEPDEHPVSARPSTEVAGSRTLGPQQNAHSFNDIVSAQKEIVADVEAEHFGTSARRVSKTKSAICNRCPNGLLGKSRYFGGVT
jgi:hypothetical protein